jgi:hypothetical protein
MVQAVVFEENQSNRTDPSQTSPMKVLRQQAVSQIIMGGTTTSANSSSVSTALSSQYTKKKANAPPVP